MVSKNKAKKATGQCDMPKTQTLDGSTMEVRENVYPVCHDIYMQTDKSASKNPYLIRSVNTTMKDFGNIAEVVSSSVQVERKDWQEHGIKTKNLMDSEFEGQREGNTDKEERTKLSFCERTLTSKSCRHIKQKKYFCTPSRSFDEKPLQYFKFQNDNNQNRYSQRKNRNTTEHIRTVSEGQRFELMPKKTVSKHWELLKCNLTVAANVIKDRTKGLITATKVELFQSSEPSDKFAKVNDKNTLVFKEQSQEKKNETQLRCLPFRQEKVKVFPFCEQYDGFSVRKTNTISESIQAILNEEKKKNESVLRGTIETVVAEILSSLPLSARSSSTDFHKEVEISESYNDEIEKHQEFENLMHLDHFALKESIFTLIYSERFQEFQDILENQETDDISTHCSSHTVAMEKNCSHIDDVVGQVNEETHDNDSTYPYLRVKIEHLNTANVVKVTIKDLKNLPELPNTKKYVDTIIKMCRMPRNGTKQMETRRSKGSYNVTFDEIFYIEEIDAENVQEEALRFQVFQKLPKTFRQQYTCVGENIMWLDEVNFSRRAKYLKIKLDPYLLT